MTLACSASSSASSTFNVDESDARVNTSISTVTQGVKALGALAGGAIGTAYGVRPALWVAALGATTTVLWTVFSPLRTTE